MATTEESLFHASYLICLWSIFGKS